MNTKKIINYNEYSFDRSKILFDETIEAMKTIANGSVDFICADLPFGKTKNKWDVVIEPELL